MAAPVHAHTDSGGITVKLAQAGYHLRLRTDNGRIEIPELAGASSTRHEMEGDLRGGGPIVDLETDSGDIQVG